MRHSFNTERLLLEQVSALRSDILKEASYLFKQWRLHIRRRDYDYSAFNAACYLALRRRDLRTLQHALVPLGLSSLGRCEGHVLASLDALTAALTSMCQGFGVGIPVRPNPRHFTNVKAILERNTRLFLPKPRARRRVRIMVTLPVEAASRYAWVRDVIKRGTDCVRINCAHDSAKEWLAMIRNVRRAERETRRQCTVLMDLCGPRARLEQVEKLRRKKRVRVGDRIWLGRDFQHRKGAVSFEAVCRLPQWLEQITPGTTIWVNGSVGAKVLRKSVNGVILEVFRTRRKGVKLRAGMGVNFSGISLRLDPLTEKDLMDLDFICKHADAVGYSFVQAPGDMNRLAHEIHCRRNLRSGRKSLAVIAKIETKRAVRNLPDIIVRGAGRGAFGVMIARGDLAIEIGFLRLAEIQEEILWLCEAAHVPVIWATQVFESFAKTGLPTRAEITDAAMSQRAECVMLNKGPFISETISILSEILVCMQAHHRKKMATFRALKSWNHLWSVRTRFQNGRFKSGSQHADNSTNRKQIADKKTEA